MATCGTAALGTSRSGPHSHNPKDQSVRLSRPLDLRENMNSLRLLAVIRCVGHKEIYGIVPKISL